MSSSAEAAVPEVRSGGRTRFTHGWRIVAALAVTQTIGYGVLYYAFSVFLTPMTGALRASGTQIAGALTLAVLTMALCSPLVGRWLDAHGGRALMTAGSVLGTLAVLAWSHVTSLPQLYGVFVAIGIASAMVLYEPAFAVVVSWFDGNGRANALLVLTIVAGFASSIFLPLTGLLVEHYGWRQALVVLAVLYGATAIPLHAFVLRRRRTAAEVKPHQRADLVKAAVRARPFWLLVAAFTAHGGAVAVVGVLLVTYLMHLGHSPVFAATIAGLLGVLSVTGRLVTTGLRSRWSAASVAAGVFALQGVGAVLLPLAGHTVPGAIGCVLMFGLGFGVGTITLPYLLAERYGTAAYASLSGRIAMFSVADKAAAPLGAVALAQAAGYGWVMAAVATACGIASFALVAYHRLSFRPISNQEVLS
ncbi:MFS transporter [Microtetraspora sp. AC03309]|uniref:MFS transporter n=1 Tax=Microtetraspora sp. AC03309 TaxID=2779376 RepID=UPI001E3CF2FC|nr:MFS transporter [Microtetraspora sp. AC03309]MCC5576288.1 MFS transporter [Microtetraspora sp. AC03309]